MKELVCNSTPIARSNIKCCLLFFVMTFMMGFFNFVYAQESQPASTPASLITTTAIDAAMEKIRMFYGLGQYDKVVIECRKLEKISPGNKMVNYYLTRAESKLAEKGLLEGLKITPEPTPTPRPAQTTAAAPTAPPSGATPIVINPIGVTPAATTAAVTPAATPLAGPNPFEAPPVTAPLVTAKPSPTPTPNPTVGVEKKTEAGPVSEPSGAVTPPATAPAPSTLTKVKRFLSENLYLIIAIAVAAVALILVASIILRIIKKKGARAVVPKEEPVREVKTVIPERAKARAPVVPPIPEDFQQGVPDLPSPPPEVGEIPAIPIPGAPRTPAAPKVAKPRMDADFSTPFPDLPEVPDIESPVATRPAPQGATDIFKVPDIPSPTQMPPSAKPSPVKPGAQTGEPGAPSDLPSLDFAADFRPAPEAVEPELPPLPSLRRESSIPEPEPPSAIETPIPESDVVPFDIPPAPEPLLSAQAVAQAPELPEGLQLERAPTPNIPSPPIEVESIDIMSAPAAPAAPPIPEGKPEAPPSISIEEAMGFDFTTGEKPQEKEAPAAGPSEAMSATSMDLETFLFSAPSEERSETALAKEQPREAKTETPSSSQTVVDGFDNLMFGGETAQETQLSSTEVLLKKPTEIPPVAPVSEERIVPTTPPVREEEPQRTTDTEAAPSERGFKELSLESLGQVVAEGETATEKGKGVSPSRQKIEERNEALFADQFKKGRDAFEKKDWKKAVHYLSVASAIKPEVKEVEEMLSVARKRKRAEK